MPIETWEVLQEAWLDADGAGSDAGEVDAAALEKNLRSSVWRSYGFSALSVVVLLYIVWELYGFVSTELPPALYVVWAVIVGLGATGLAAWKLYLRFSFTRGLALNSRDHVDFMLRRAISRQRLSFATIASVGFYATMIIGLSIARLHDLGLAEFLTLKRTVGLGVILAILSVISGIAARGRKAATKEATALVELQRSESLAYTADEPNS